MTFGSTRPRVCVLMSLYRGTRYLAQQIESIAAQADVDVHILARDDGSGDDTAVVFQMLAQEHGVSHTLIEGENLGACDSFFELIKAAPEDFDAYAFSDQDDWWRQEKMARAVQILHGADDTPMLYFCGQTVADQQLSPLHDTMRFERIGFGNALVQNVVQGASAVVNPSGMQLLQSLGRPTYTFMHDWWMYLVFAALGQLQYDHYAGMLYRQHDANVVGVRVSRWSRWRDRVRRYVNGGDSTRSRQAIAFQAAVGDRLAAKEAALLATFIAARHHAGARVRLLAGGQWWFQHRVDDIVFRAALALGRY